MRRRPARLASPLPRIRRHVRSYRHRQERPGLLPRRRRHHRRRFRPWRRRMGNNVARITRERAERIARGHACENCGEYTYKKLAVKPASKEEREGVDVAWIASKTCGVC